MTRIRVPAQLRTTIESGIDRVVRDAARRQHDPGYQFALDDDAPGMECEIIVHLVPASNRSILARRAAS